MRPKLVLTLACAAQFMVSLERRAENRARVAASADEEKAARLAADIAT